jgi:hypothetical protein
MLGRPAGYAELSTSQLDAIAWDFLGSEFADKIYAGSVTSPPMTIRSICGEVRSGIDDHLSRESNDRHDDAGVQPALTPPQVSRLPSR